MIDQEFNELIQLSQMQQHKGPLYRQLQQVIIEGIESGRLSPASALPTERELAELTNVSRVTVRRAIGELVTQGILIQRQGSGTYIAPKIERMEQTLRTLTSFTQEMSSRGKQVSSQWLDRTISLPSPDETMRLGLSSTDRVARLSRLRLADNVPLAYEHATISNRFLPDPERVTHSLYQTLHKLGYPPERAVQKITAINVDPEMAHLLEVATGKAALQIDRLSYLPDGRILEATKTIYRAGAYDFIAELELDHQDILN
ncbi:GntR family transcriptional regulator [Polycladidibacter stylochi]|uniref:GntR family transcriptional regulator n=1 Tax=Polycladidibacter stylochi TaxID=1807766 RepID=UPI000AD5C4AF|nr:GntR family transcriptional regulator [Pseudovibrio stylochi]